MKKATFAALLLSALASGYGVTCHAATYDYTQAMGSLELEFSEESGDPIVTIETVNPNNGSTCSFESEGCRFDEDGLTCFSESGDLVLKYRDDDLIEVTAEPDGMCGLNATMLGYYTPREESAAPSLYRPTSGEGSLQLEFSEDSGDPIVTIETVNPNNGSTCSFESEGCRFDEDGLTCFSESGDLVLKYRENDVIEVTQEPDGMCGLNATMLGTYVPAQSSGQTQSAALSKTAVFYPTFSEGSLELEFSEESGDLSVAIETVNPTSAHTCSFESEGCTLTEDGLRCPSEDGVLELKFIDQNTVEVTAEPSGTCGLRATMIGTYVSEQSASHSSGATVYRPDDGEGTLSIAVSEESGDVSVAIETVNPNSGHTCSFESEVCNLTDEGLSCPTEDGALELKFLGEGAVEVTAEPSGMCGLRATMLGVYRR